MAKFSPELIVELKQKLAEIEARPILEPGDLSSGHFNRCHHHSYSKPDRFHINFYSRKKPEETTPFVRSRSLRTSNRKPVNNNKDNDVVWMNIEQIKPPKADNRPLSMAQFLRIKELRDIECSKLYQATKALDCMQGASGRWRETLAAEKILLHSGRVVEAIVSKMRENRQVEMVNFRHRIVLSKFKFHLDNFERNSIKTQFFILLITSGMQVRVSKIFRSGGHCLIMDDDFEFKVQDQFNIEVEIYSMELWDLKRQNHYFSFCKKHQPQTQISRYKLRYKNIYTGEIVCNDVRHSAFKLEAKLVLTHNSDMTKNDFEMATYSGSDLNPLVSCCVNTEDLRGSLEKSGFVNLGSRIHDFYSWNLRWCDLRGLELKFYHSPEDDVPYLILDLQNCCSQKVDVAPRVTCPRSGSILLNFKMEDDNNQLETYFLRPQRENERSDWINKINAVLELKKELF